MEDFDFSSIWLKYGLQDTPYSTSPLRLFGAMHIEKVFSNREREIKELGMCMHSARSTRTLIIGEPGVGKTTFGNYLRWLLCRKDILKSKFLTTPVELKVQNSWDNEQFLRSSLAAIYNANIIFDWKKQGIKVDILKELESYIKHSRKKSFGIGSQVVGTGGNINYGETLTLPNNVPPEILEDFFLRIIKEINDQGKAVILQYNNLENVETEKLASLIRSVREFLQIDGLHSFFLGPSESLSAIEMYPQVHSVFGKTITLESLTDLQVLEILKKRCMILKIPDGNYIPPYSEETVKSLHKILNNNIRFVFKILDDVTNRAGENAPCKISLKDIQSYSEEESKRKFEDLTDNEKKVLSALLSKPHLTQGELAEITNISSSNLSNKELKILKKKGLIVVYSDPSDKRFNIIKTSENTQLIFTFSGKQISKYTIFN